jgi:hypothetical protein
MSKRPFMQDREARHFEAAMRRALVEVSSESTLREIRAAVVKAFGVEVGDIMQTSRFIIDVMARQAFMAMSRRLTEHSTTEIGALCGDVDHTTVLHACRKYRDVLDRVLGPEPEPTENRVKRSARTKAEWIEERRHDHLARLVEWSVEDSWSATEDVYPEINQIAANRRLQILRQRGWAESELFENNIWWRVTPLGRKAFQRRKEELLAGGSGQQRGEPGAAAFAPLASPRLSPELAEVA